MPPAGRDLDELIEAITVDCYGDDEEMGAFLQAFEEELAFPVEAAVVGVGVEVVGVEHGGDVRRGLVARCRRDGRDYEVGLADIVLPGESPSSTLHAAFRRWLGCEPASGGRR